MLQTTTVMQVIAALQKGAVIYASISGGKDGQAMATVLQASYLPIHAFIHADLGKVEWNESLPQCEMIAARYSLPLHIIKRADGRGLLEHWRDRMNKLKGSGKPFWSSSKQRYCTSDLKRDPINKFFRNCGHNFIISAEGIRADESKDRKKKKPLSIRPGVTSSYYRGMTVDEAIKSYNPAHRLVLTAYPVFDFSLAQVWATEGLTQQDLEFARVVYKIHKVVPYWWHFHPAYAYGNDRVSCAFCILGSLNDLKVGAEHKPELLSEMIKMEDEGNATFKKGFSLKELL